MSDQPQLDLQAPPAAPKAAAPARSGRGFGGFTRAQLVMGAILIYVACYMILAGIQVITSRMLDARRTFVVGIALIFGLSVDMVPGLYRDVPNLVQPLFSSSLAISTVLVVVLNLIFRIGVTKRQAEVSFDEFNLDVDIRYDGELMEFPSRRPTEEALLTDEKAVASLSAFLIRQYADRVKAEMSGGRCRVQIHFDH